ncbi:MAG: carbonic anhydrase family protein [Actinomycetia bacterium]|nr:carbonic anhydrase family protein [Actinomycetes bacterium]
MSGCSQSPIDLGVAVPSEPLDLAIDYSPSVHHGHDAGTTHNVPVSSGHSISYGGRGYELDSYHFHTPSEHSIAGEFAAAEIHLVHTNAAGDVAVLGVLVDEKEEAAGPLHFGEPTSIESLLPDTTTHYAYEGSLTRPPYTEGVVWIVMKERITRRPEWIETFKEQYGANNRPLQPLNGRTVTLG